MKVLRTRIRVGPPGGSSRGLGCAALVGLAVAWGGSPHALRAETREAPESVERTIEVRRARPLFFEANEGQVDARVKFLFRGGGQTLFLTPTEAVLVLGGPPAARKHPTLPGPAWRQRAWPHERSVLRMSLVGANPAPVVRGRDALPGKVSYYRGRDPSRWRTGVTLFGRVEYGEVYPGVTLAFYGKEGHLEYDFIVGPGADPGVIRFELKGAKSLRLDTDGNLVAEVAGREVVQRAPVLYQDVGGFRRSVRGRYLLKGKREVAFQIGEYEHSEPLVIDPVLVYSTFLGGSGDDHAFAVAVDASDNVYVTGMTQSVDFPTAGTPPQGANAGGEDVFVTKLAPDSALIYSTYLGGSGNEWGTGIAVDGAGNAYVTGWTDSTDFPTAGVPSQAANIGNEDAFVTMLDPTSALVYSTYLGGSGQDRGAGIAVDGAGNAHVTGFTDSTDFPTAGTPSQVANAGNHRDAFVTKLDSTSALVYSTYLGGFGDDMSTGIALDGSGNAYVTGSTNSTDFPIAGSASQPASSGFGDGFVTKLSPTSALLYSTYLGGSANDSSNDIAVDGSGNAYVVGYTFSLDFPTAGSPPQTAHGGGFYDGFVTKLSPTSALVYSTYLGGSGSDGAEAVAVDAVGNAYVTGGANTTFPLVLPLQGCGPLSTHAFVTKLGPGGGLAYSTCLGGSNLDSGAGIAVPASGDAYVVGSTFSADFPTAGTPSQPTLAGLDDAFVARISGLSPPLRLYLVTPCRIADTRNPVGLLGGPALAAGVDRTFPITGACGIPPTAKAVALNWTVTQPTSPGNVRLHPGGTTVSLVSSINYSAGQTRGNNGIVPLGIGGDLAAYCAQSSGTVHLILDVSGYFE